MTNLCDARRRTPVLIALLAFVATVAPGCGGILGSDEAVFADVARVTVDGTSAVPLLLVTSVNFAAVTDPETGELVASIVEADIDTLNALPFDGDYDVRGFNRFLARLVNPDTAVTATIHLKVFFDGELVFDQRATMKDASLEFIGFHSR